MDKLLHALSVGHKPYCSQTIVFETYYLQHKNRGAVIMLKVLIRNNKIVIFIKDYTKLLYCEYNATSNKHVVRV